MIKNNKYDEKKLLNFIDFNINYLENILFTLSHRRRKNKKILNNSTGKLINVFGYKSC